MCRDRSLLAQEMGHLRSCRRWRLHPCETDISSDILAIVDDEYPINLFWKIIGFPWCAVSDGADSNERLQNLIQSFLCDRREPQPNPHVYHDIHTKEEAEKATLIYSVEIQFTIYIINDLDKFIDHISSQLTVGYLR